MRRENVTLLPRLSSILAEDDVLGRKLQDIGLKTGKRATKK
jgi:hypothetical protein